MPGITVNKHINAPCKTVFDYAADIPNAADRISGIESVEMLTDGPVGVGTRFRETRIMFKRKATEEMEFTSFDAPNGYTVKAESCGCRYRSEFRFTPNGQGTDVTMSFDAQPMTVFAKIMSFMMKPMLKACAKMCEKDLDDLKAAIEADTVGSS